MSERASTDDARAALARVCASALFARSLRHQRLLRYLVEETLANRLANLREIHLGVHIFDRPAASFDPAVDTIVRVEARRLRARLQRYYDGDGGEGRDDAVRIVLSAGSYVPALLRVQPVAPELRDDDALPVVAVLPLDAFGEAPGGDAPTQPSADALTEALTEALARMPGVRVVARTSALRFRGARQDIRDIAQQLGADVLIEGSLQAADGHWRAVVQVIAANDGLHLWSDAHSRPAGDRFRFYDEVGARLCAALPAVLANLHDGDDGDAGRVDGIGAREQRAAVTTGKRAAAPRATTADALDEATRDRWERGRMAIRTRTTSAIAHATALFREVVAAAPDFAPGHASLAASLLQQAGMTMRPAAEVGPELRAEAQRALALDPHLAEAHATLGVQLLHYEHDWPQAERALLRAIHFGPNLVSALRAYAFALTFRRRFDEAERLFARARRLDPLDAQTRAHHGLLRFYQRRYDEAIVIFADLLATDAGNVLARTLLAASRLHAGDADAAERLYRDASARHPDLSIGVCGLAVTLARAGRRDEALQARQALVDFAARGYVSPYQLAMIDAALGDTAAALRQLRAAAAANDYNFQCAAVDPTFDALHADPGWQALLRDYGLPAD